VLNYYVRINVSVFKYANEYKQFYDLMLNNTTIDPTLVGAKAVDDAIAEFALGKSVILQNGDWSWGTISATDGIKITSDDVSFITPCIGVSGEENYGICGGGSNNIAVNSTVSEAEQKAALDFIEWMFSNEEAKKIVVEQLGFVTPFSTFEGMQYSNPLQSAEAHFAALGKQTYCWACSLIPGAWDSEFGADLLAYAQGQTSWDEVVKKAVDNWTTEKELASSQE